MVKGHTESERLQGTDGVFEFSELDWMGTGYLVQTRDILGKGIVLLLHVDIRIMMLSCSYLGHSCDNFLISYLKLETKSGRK